MWSQRELHPLYLFKFETGSTNRSMGLSRGLLHVVCGSASLLNVFLYFSRLKKTKANITRVRQSLDASKTEVFFL